MPKPLSVDDVINRREPLRDINKEIAENIGLLERIAVWITERVGGAGLTALLARYLGSQQAKELEAQLVGEVLAAI